MFSVFLSFLSLPSKRCVYIYKRKWNLILKLSLVGEKSKETQIDGKMRCKKRGKMWQGRGKNRYSLFYFFMSLKNKWKRTFPPPSTLSHSHRWDSKWVFLLLIISLFPRDIFSCSAASSTISPLPPFFLLLFFTIENSPHPLYVYIHTQSSLNHTCLVPLSPNIYNAFGCISIYTWVWTLFFFLFPLYIFQSIWAEYKKVFTVMAVRLFVCPFPTLVYFCFVLSITPSLL